MGIKEKTDFCKIMSNRQRVQFDYAGKLRIAEPQCYGITFSNKESVRFHMVKGGSRPEQLFEVSKMTNIEALDDYFTKPGPNYVKNDSAFKEIFCQL